MPVNMSALKDRLKSIDFSAKVAANIDLSMFYHPDTLNQLLVMRRHLKENQKPVDLFLQLLALQQTPWPQQRLFQRLFIPSNLRHSGGPEPNKQKQKTKA